MRNNIAASAAMIAHAFAFLMMLGAPANTEPVLKHIPDAGRGEEIVKRLCVNCHVISKDTTTTVPEGVPTFHALANDHEQTAKRIRATLIEPHTPMPDMHMSRNEIDDIIAYLDTLREPGSGPSLLRNNDKPGKHVYPDAG